MNSQLKSTYVHSKCSIGLHMKSTHTKAHSFTQMENVKKRLHTTGTRV